MSTSSGNTFQCVECSQGVCRNTRACGREEKKTKLSNAPTRPNIKLENERSAEKQTWTEWEVVSRPLPKASQLKEFLSQNLNRYKDWNPTSFTTNHQAGSSECRPSPHTARSHNSTDVKINPFLWYRSLFFCFPLNWPAYGLAFCIENWHWSFCQEDERILNTVASGCH